LPASSNVPRLDAFLASDQASRARTARLEADLAAAWRAALNAAAREAAGRLRTIRGAADPTDPGWSIPDIDELLPAAKILELVERRTARLRTRALRLSMEGTLAEFGLSFDLANPLAMSVEDELARRVVAVSEAERSGILDALRTAHADGLSIPDAAKAMRQEVSRLSTTRAKTIARTELGHAQNAGSLAAARLTGAADRKCWLATEDSRTRPDHADAAGRYGPGSGIPLDARFTVGDASLDHPHDPDGPPDETANCRCTLTYEDADPAVTGAAAAAPAGQAPIVVHVAAERQPGTTGLLDDVRRIVAESEERTRAALEQIAARPVQPPRALRVERDEHGNAIRYIPEDPGA
jgi:hypothetical protein